MKQREGDTARFSCFKEYKEALIHFLCTGDGPLYLQLQILCINMQK